MRKPAMSLVLPTLICACAVEPLVEYTPIFDPYRTDMEAFNKDLIECRSIALTVEADYKKRKQEQETANLLTGVLVGALFGAVVGAGSDSQGDMIASGSAAGASAGVSSNDYGHDLVKFGPRRVVDRCMSDRGYALLNDVGRG